MPPTFLEFEQLKLVTEFSNGGYKHIYRTAQKPLRCETWTRAELLGDGTFGTVYRETCAERGDVRAVKQIKKSFARPNELAILAQLRSYPEHFVQLSGWFEDENNIYLAMEYLPGDLDALLREQDLSEDDTRRVTKQILAGLEIMHEQDICHRDLKPGNILIAKWIPISVKIADFGVSKHFDGTAGRTETGTRPFMAPEVWGFGDGKSSVYTTAIDMWSLGCLVYFMFTKRTPFPEPRDLVDFMQSEGTFPPSSAVDIVQGIPRGAIEFIATLLQPLPAARTTAAKAKLHSWLSIEEQDDTLWEPQSSELPTEPASRATPKQMIGGTKGRRLGAGHGLGPPGPKKQPRVPREGRVIQDTFIAAAGRGNCELLRALIERGADIEARNPKNHSALSVATRGGHFETVKLLLERGADFSSHVGVQGWTILGLAARHGYLNIVSLLLDKGADIHASKANNGCSALQLAVQMNSHEVVLLLLERGADISHKNFQGFGAVHMSAEFGSVESLRILRDWGADVSERGGPERLTPLHVAAENGQVDVMQFLLDTGVDISAKRTDGMDALQCAALWGRLNAARLLLERGASTTSRNNNGRTATFLAVDKGHTDVVLLLVDWSKKGTAIPLTELKNLKLTPDRMQHPSQASGGDESTAS